jgi:hypothetical protein
LRLADAHEAHEEDAHEEDADAHEALKNLESLFSLLFGNLWILLHQPQPDAKPSTSTKEAKEHSGYSEASLAMLPNYALAAQWIARCEEFVKCWAKLGMDTEHFHAKPSLHFFVDHFATWLGRHGGTGWAVAQGRERSQEFVKDIIKHHSPGIHLNDYTDANTMQAILDWPWEWWCRFLSHADCDKIHTKGKDKYKPLVHKITR